MVTGSNGCTSTATAEVEQDTDVPGAQAAGGTITCSNECVMLTGTGNGSFAWSGPSNFNSTEQNPTVCAPASTRSWSPAATAAPAPPPLRWSRTPMSPAPRPLAGPSPAATSA
ncbi:MAG: hypothetical protein IPF41_08610 [Flavobacteriales bacterium]|nr:hypothetical protein [Flavobacteriales bacterium]